MITKAHILAVSRTRSFQVSLASVASFAAGAALSYVIAGKKLELKYAAIAEQEIQEAKDYYRRLGKDGEFADPEELFKHLEEENLEVEKAAAEKIVDDQGYAVHTPYRKISGDAAGESPDRVPGAHPALVGVLDDGSPQAKKLIEEGKELAKELEEAEANSQAAAETEGVEVVAEVRTVDHHNIFKDARSANSFFDYDEEIAKRTADRPYIITIDEFLENAPENEQVSYTYYEEDDVLADEQDKPIEDTERVVGNENLTRFGYGSNDRNTVHIRNEKLELDFEIAKSTGSFAKEVYGFVEHSDEPRVRRMRRDDG